MRRERGLRSVLVLALDDDLAGRIDEHQGVVVAVESHAVLHRLLVEDVDVRLLELLADLFDDGSNTHAGPERCSARYYGESWRSAAS